MNDAGDINVLVYVRGHEKYIWLYRDDQLPDVQRSLGRLACNPDLPFTWLDAAKCAASARKQITNGSVLSQRR